MPTAPRRSHQPLLPATRPNLSRALQFIGRKNGGGGTRLLAALQRAVALPRQSGVARSIVLVTDGYIEAESDVFDYVRDQLEDANFFAFGIGSSVNRFLIEGVARAGLGEPFIVTEPAEAAEAASRLRRYIDSPVLTGIDVTFQGFDAYDVEPRKVPDLFAGRPIVVFGKWRGAARGSIEISGKTGRGVYQTSIAVAPGALERPAGSPSPSVGTNPDREPVRLRARRAVRGTRRRDHLARADLWPAHAVHVVHCRAGDRAAHHRGRGRRRPAAAAAGGRLGPRRRHDERRRTRARMDLRDRSGVVWLVHGCCARSARRSGAGA